MFNRSPTVLCVAVILLCSFSQAYAYSHYRRPPSQEEIDARMKELSEKRQELQKKQEKLAEEQNRLDTDRINRRRTRVNKNIEEIQQEFQDLAESYRTGSVWKQARDETEQMTNSKWRFFKYPLIVPSYVIRAATWPVAVIADYLIRKGAVNEVVNFFSSDDRSFWFYPKLELGFGAGFGGGVGIKHYDLFRRDYTLSASYQIHVNLNQEVYTSLEKDDAFYFAGHPINFKFLTGFIRHNNDAYYGIGPTSSKGNISTYGINGLESGGYIGHTWGNHISANWHTYAEYSSAYRGTGGAQKTSDVYPRNQIPGIDRDLVYIKYGIEVEHDTRNNDVEPGQGGLRKASFMRHQGLGTIKFDYNEYKISAVQYFRALMPRHTFVMRNAWEFLQITDDTIPFYRLARLDVYSPMRGFDFGRFMDNASMVVNLEYRFPIWRFLDAQFFFDTGRVFHSPSDFAFKHFKYDGGIGLRVITENYFLLRFQVGYGGEGVKFLLKTGQEF